MPEKGMPAYSQPLTDALTWSLLRRGLKDKPPNWEEQKTQTFFFFICSFNTFPNVPNN
jgi:hypothetical protein